MLQRPEFNKLKIELLGLIGIMEAMEVNNSKQLDAEFRRFSVLVSNRLPIIRKESIDVYRTSDDTIIEDSTIK